MVTKPLRGLVLTENSDSESYILYRIRLAAEWLNGYDALIGKGLG
ncbi:hypothetical protein MC7420_76 [Coleofasciculus chthonoplastes PCC 7420]|uniref:Uncharacterized protein n=1 Tax=Coleofasciculus chthonoplastes PCC 7420 TaxID=118168 RepID=B4W2V9_9CYAN|nr:hypothetical protein MC7420_76 [Coleofasciculus chthonoplastes PCC 7420]